MEARRAAINGNAELSDEDRERLLAELAADEERLRAKMEGAQERARAKVAAKLKAKRKRLEARAIAKSDGREEEDEKTKEKEKEGGPEEVEGPREEEEEEEEGVTEHDSWIDALLKTSPLFSALRAAERLSTGDFKDPGHRSNPDTGRFLEERDAQYRTEGKLKPVEVAALPPRQLHSLQTGLLLVRLAAEENGLPPVKVLLADKLPHNHFERNAFRHSVAFDPKAQVLFIRRARADNPADFLTCLLHAVSHVQAGSLETDDAPEFRSVFFKVRAFSEV